MKRINEKEGMDVSVSEKSFMRLWEAIESNYKFSNESWHIERQICKIGDRTITNVLLCRNDTEGEKGINFNAR